MDSSKKNWKRVWSIFWVFLFVALLISFFVFQKVDINGKSMEPNYFAGELLIVNRFSKNIERGQVVTFYSDEDQLAQTSTWEKLFPFFSVHPNKIFLKRVVGMPGEEIEIIGSNVIIYNGDNPDGALLKEEYLDPAVIVKTNDPTINDHYYTPKTKLGDEEYFLMGDNRPVSTDSRDQRYGAFSKDSLFGKEVLRYWPASKFRTFKLPDYKFIKMNQEKNEELEKLKNDYNLMKQSLVNVE